MNRVIESQPSVEEINIPTSVVNRSPNQNPRTHATNAVANRGAPLSTFDGIYSKAASLDRFGMGALRLGLIVVLCRAASKLPITKPKVLCPSSPTVH